MALGKLPKVRPLETFPVELDMTRNLRLDAQALMRYETITGDSVFNSSAWSNMSMTKMVTLLWCGFLHEDEKLKRDHIAQQIHLGNINYVEEILGAALKRSMPDDEDQGDGNDPLP